MRVSGKMVGWKGKTLGAAALMGAACGLLGAPAPAAAEEPRIVLAAADAFEAKPLTPNELGEERAKGAEISILTPGSTDFAVILFDESSKRPAPAGGSASHSYSQSRGGSSASISVVVGAH